MPNPLSTLLLLTLTLTLSPLPVLSQKKGLNGSYRDPSLPLLLPPLNFFFQKEKSTNTPLQKANVDSNPTVAVVVRVVRLVVKVCVFCRSLFFLRMNGYECMTTTAIMTTDMTTNLR